MKKWLIASAMTVVLFGTSAIAATSGTFRQAHEYGYGDKSSLDPASRGRVMQITEKLMSRLIRPDMKGSPSPDLATSWSANSAATEWTLKLRKGVNTMAAPLTHRRYLPFNRVLNPENKSPARSAIKMIEKMEAVKLSNLSTPFADMPLQLMDWFEDYSRGFRRRHCKVDWHRPLQADFFDAAGDKLEANMVTGRTRVAKMKSSALVTDRHACKHCLADKLILKTLLQISKACFANSNKFKIMEVPTGGAILFFVQM